MKYSTAYTYPKQTSSSSAKIYRLGGKFYGSLGGNIFFRSNATLYREFDSYGMDKWLVSELEKDGCKTLCFIDKNAACRYTIDFDKFKRHGKTVSHAGWSVQLHCERKYWQAELLPKQLALEVAP